METKKKPEDNYKSKRRFLNKITNLACRDTVLDIGINRGEYSEYFLNAGYKVVAVESDESKLKELNFFYGDSPNFAIVAFNLSDKNDTPVIEADDIWNFETGGTIDFIKLDTKGNELDIVVGADRIIHEYSPIFILNVSVAMSHHDADDLAEYLHSFGYSFVSQCGDGLTLEDVVNILKTLNAKQIIAMP